MNPTEALDDYLDGLLQDVSAGAGAAPAQPQAASAPAAAPATPAPPAPASGDTPAATEADDRTQESPMASNPLPSDNDSTPTATAAEVEPTPVAATADSPEETVTATSPEPESESDPPTELQAADEDQIDLPDAPAIEVSADEPVASEVVTETSAPAPELIAADVIAEMDDDPAFDGGKPAAPVAPAAPDPEVIAADLLAEMDADPAFANSKPAPAKAPDPEMIAADLLAEMDADPAFVGSQPAKSAAPDPATIAADLLAEMDADPAFAGSKPAPASTPDADAIAADLLAEMDADPAFAGSKPAPASASAADAIAADLLAEMDADPAFTAASEAPEPAAKVPAPAAPAAKQSPPVVKTGGGPRLPPNLQAFMPPAHEEMPTGAAAEAPSERSSRWLRLRCGDQAYALELLKVQEVVLPVPLLPLRGTGPSMLGIMNLRGQVVPVIDLGMHLGAGQIQDDLHTRVVVLEENGETMGLRVTAVDDVTSLTAHQIEPPDTGRICRISNKFFRGVARIANQPMILLDASQLLH